MDVIKSSRFWIAVLIIVGVFVLAILKHIPAQEAVSYALAILAGFGVGKFSTARGVAGVNGGSDEKPTPAPAQPPPTDPSSTPLLALFALPALLAMASCAEWQVKTTNALHATFETVKIVQPAANDFMHQRCMKIALECKARKVAAAPATSQPQPQPASKPTAATPASQPEVCSELLKCQEVKHTINGLAVAVHHAIVAGLLAVQLGDEQTAAGWMVKIGTAVLRLKNAVEAAGLLDFK